MGYFQRLFPILVLTFFTLFSSGCAFVSLKNWFDQSGQVIYHSNEKPVPNAIIAAIWRGTKKDAAEGDADTICYHVATTTTDNNGKFTIPGWREYFEYSHVKDKSVSVVVYKPGFWTENTLHSAPTERQHTYRIESASEQNKQTSSKHRLRYLQKLVGLTSCDMDGESKRTLKEMYSNILNEAEGVASTPMDKKVVDSLKNWTTFVAASS